VAGGRYVRLVTLGRASGTSRDVTVGYADDPRGLPGSIVVASGGVDSDWALNLLAHPACTATIGARTFRAVAEPLADSDHATAIRTLILRYGTSAEGLGHGPSFRLVPAGDDDGADGDPSEGPA
jgi:deazaflavin-dependent oxidoreductase (nitroreductase family)